MSNALFKQNPSRIFIKICNKLSVENSNIMVYNVLVYYYNRVLDRNIERSELRSAGQLFKKWQMIT